MGLFLVSATLLGAFYLSPRDLLSWFCLLTDRLQGGLLVALQDGVKLRGREIKEIGRANFLA